MTSATDRCHSALDLAQRLLIRPAADQPEAPEIMRELVAAFDATAAGLAPLPEGQPYFLHPPQATTIPQWPIEACVLEQVRHAPGAVGTAAGEGRRLLTTLTVPGGLTWVLWVFDGRRDTWADEELAALSLVGSAIARRLDGQAGTPWAELLDRAARQERLEIAANVIRRLAHDFGNVLTGILGFTELAQAQQVPPNTPLGSYLQEVYRAAQNGAQFTHQLRLFSRRQSASSRGSPLATILAEQEARLFAANPAGVNLRLNLPPDLPPVALDAEHLHHVLSVLLDNAAEALVGPGAISVSARVIHLEEAGCRELFGAALPGPHVEIVIADTGIGLSPEVQRRLFTEPFYSTKPRHRGFGLAIAYGILHAHRGGLRLHAGEERGVVARVLVPVAPAACVVGEEVVRPSERIRGERLLVVDDEIEVLQLVRGILERAGYRVDAFSSAEPALEAYATAGNDPFRLVVSDVVMPGVNGVDLARRLLRRDPQARVLFMSGHVFGDLGQPDLASHAFELLAKPFRTEQLLRAVQNNLDRVGRLRSAGLAVTKK